MNILLINPPFLPGEGKFSREQRSPAITKSGTFYYPMWLCFATGVLENAGHECRLIDAPAIGVDIDNILERHLSSFHPDMIVVDTSTPSVYNDVEVAALLKKKYNAFTVLVGTHPSALPEDVLNIDKSIDAVIRGEYEYPLLNLTEVLKDNKDSLNTVGSLSFRSDDGEIVNNPLAEFANDLDNIPFVSKVYKKHLDYQNYFSSLYILRLPAGLFQSEAPL
jgi:radical SAM superfamily enzyme YgiQ (UPF0313 family)